MQAALGSMVLENPAFSSKALGVSQNALAVMALSKRFFSALFLCALPLSEKVYLHVLEQ